MGVVQSQTNKYRQNKYRRQLEQVPPGPNPFTDAECKDILNKWQHCIDTPFTIEKHEHGYRHKVKNCYNLNAKALQYCGGLKKLNLRPDRFNGIAEMTTEEMQNELVNYPTKDRDWIRRNLYRKEQCQLFDTEMDENSEISKLVYYENCSDVPRQDHCGWF